MFYRLKKTTRIEIKKILKLVLFVKAKITGSSCNWPLFDKTIRLRTHNKPNKAIAHK